MVRFHHVALGENISSLRSQVPSKNGSFFERDTKYYNPTKQQVIL
jgi:hypothetical protein